MTWAEWAESSYPSGIDQEYGSDILIIINTDSVFIDSEYWFAMCYDSISNSSGVKVKPNDLIIYEEKYYLSNGSCMSAGGAGE